MANDWFKVFRQLEKSVVFQDSDLLKVWMWCLIRANYTENSVPIRTGGGIKIVKVKPGQFIFGRHEAAIALRMKPSTVRDRMQRLQVFGNITIHPDTHHSVVTVVKWADFQDEDSKPDKQPDKLPTSCRQAADTEKKDKNINTVIHKDHHFSASPYADLETFLQKISTVPTMRGWTREFAEKIHSRMLTWSASSVKNKRLDWIAVARTFAETADKLSTFKPREFKTRQELIHEKNAENLRIAMEMTNNEGIANA